MSVEKTYPLIWYGGRLFRPVKTQGSSETSSETIFKYEQKDALVTATYSGGDIRLGHLIGLVNKNGSLDMRYHHVNTDGALMTGTCHTIPEVLDDGRLRLHESWQWTSGPNISDPNISGFKTRGASILEEL